MVMSGEENMTNLALNIEHLAELKVRIIGLLRHNDWRASEMPLKLQKSCTQNSLRDVYYGSRWL